MPYRPAHPCSHPGCPNLTHERFCEVHKKQADKEYNQYQRDVFSKTFYNTPRWRATRTNQLKKSPFCEECRKNGTIVKASIVDHIIPIKQGGNPFDENNLQSLCWSCHSRKSVNEGSRFGKCTNQTKKT